MIDCSQDVLLCNFGYKKIVYIQKMKAECKLGNIFSSAEQQKYCGLLKDLKHNCNKLKNIDSEVYVHVADSDISVPIRRFTFCSPK